jgi:hypothetical protein
MGDMEGGMDSDLTQLAHVRSLRTLSLWGTPLTGRATAQLSAATQLTSLTFGTDVSDAHVQVRQSLCVKLWHLGERAERLSERSRLAAEL